MPTSSARKPAIYIVCCLLEETRGLVLTTVEFICADCEQSIEVNEEMRETILATGCPVCTSSASEDDFVAEE